MNFIFRYASLTAISLAVTGCMVREEDLDSWVGQPVTMLDTHPLFVTVPMTKTIAADGTEVRNYRNGKSVKNCNLNPNNPYVTTISCFANDIVCNNIFYIRNGRVLRYAPTGRCYTDASVQPQKMY